MAFLYMCFIVGKEESYFWKGNSLNLKARGFRFWIFEKNCGNPEIFSENTGENDSKYTKIIIILFYIYRVIRGVYVSPAAKAGIFA